MKVPEEVLEDFRNHLFFCFKYLGIGEPSPLQYAMAHRVQNGPRDFQLQAGRGAGKSTVVAIFASWLLLKDPNTTIMVISAGQDKAISFISQVRQILSALYGTPDSTGVRQGQRIWIQCRLQDTQGTGSILLCQRHHWTDHRLTRRLCTW